MHAVNNTGPVQKDFQPCHMIVTSCSYKFNDQIVVRL